MSFDFLFSGHKIDKLQDFLSKLFDPPIDLRFPACPGIDTKEFLTVGLHKTYHAAMEIAEKSGYIELALQSS